MSEPYTVAFPDHPVANVRQADAIRTALQVLPGIERLGYPSPDFRIATTAGPLTLSVYPHLTGPGVLFAGRFLDNARARQRLGSTWGLHPLNPLSGKWNHDFYGLDPQWNLRSFLGQLLPLIPLPESQIVYAAASSYQAQIVTEWRGIQWRAAMGRIAEPTWMASLTRLEPWTPEHGPQRTTPPGSRRRGRIERNWLKIS